jgi:predicted RNase H-like HicB family nuclease/predicted RNA binding protein YcfA (HicA-like mRNA interferase family)
MSSQDETITLGNEASIIKRGFSMIEFGEKIGKRQKMKYKVVIRKSEEGYDISCPVLPGCWSQGETEADAIDNIRSAIVEYLSAVNETLKDADVREVDVPA